MHLKNQLKRLLFESVKIRLMSEVPLGAFLSGGIDSSIIVAIMAMQSENPVNTFSIGLKNNPSSELNYARKISEHFGTNHTEFEIDLDNYQILPDSYISIVSRKITETFASSLWDVATVFPN